MVRRVVRDGSEIEAHREDEHSRSRAHVAVLEPRLISPIVSCSARLDSAATH